MMKLLLLLGAIISVRAQDVSDLREYTIRVHTGDVSGAGTNADVFLTIMGDLGVTAEHQLDTPSHDDFERGQHDIFQFIDNNVGVVTKIRIRQDDTGYKPGWFLENLNIEIYADNADYDFPCQWWLASDEPGGIDRVLSPGQSCSPYY